MEKDPDWIGRFGEQLLSESIGYAGFPKFNKSGIIYMEGLGDTNPSGFIKVLISPRTVACISLNPWKQNTPTICTIGYWVSYLISKIIISSRKIVDAGRLISIESI